MPAAGGGDVGPAAPSFRYKLHESKRRSAHLREHGLRTPVWQYNGKLAGYRLAERCGVSVPGLLRAAIGIDAISSEELSAFGDRFVVKPHTGAYSRGVHLLVRRDGDRFHDLVDGAECTWGELVSEQLALVAEGKVSRRVAVEELLAPAASMADRVEVPDDWKIYCCYDRPVVVMQRRLFASMDASRWRFRYWSPDWVDLGAAMDPPRHGPDLEPPVDGAALIEVAAAIGREAKAPFCRIDLYETDRGVVFGELTPHPGGPQAWRDDIDELLGREWEAAEARLLVEGEASLIPLAGRPDGREPAMATNPRSGVEVEVGADQAVPGTGAMGEGQLEDRRAGPAAGDSLDPGSVADAGSPPEPGSEPGSAPGPEPVTDLPGSLVAELAERAPAVGLTAEALVAFRRSDPPSFRARLAASARQRLLLRTLGARSAVWQYNGKLEGYDLARRIGVPIPELFHLAITVGELDPAGLPHRFVLKPHGGASSRGVQLLERHDDRFLDVRTGLVRGWGEVVEELVGLARSGAISSSLMVEELLSPPPERAGTIPVPDDWKVHCFDGRPLLVMQRRVVDPAAGDEGAAGAERAAGAEGAAVDHEPSGADVPDRRRFRYWSTTWDDLGAAKDPETHDPTLEPPVDGAAIVEAAARIGAELRVPFCRVDLYETDRGVVFGEVTPQPGGRQRWRPDLDLLLGREWEAAEARLLAEHHRWVVPRGDRPVVS